MKSKSKKMFDGIINFTSRVTVHHSGAYAAQAAYFFILSLIPIILLLLTMIQYTPITREMVMTTVVNVFPNTVNGLIVSIVNQVYTQSRTIIPVTVLVALWSAGKGVLSITTGLNCVYDCQETRNYFFLRLRATVYTLLFIVAIIASLMLSVFGNSISSFVAENAPFLMPVTEYLIQIRTLFSTIFLTVLWVMVYKFLPNRRTTFAKQIPGALVTAFGWLLISFFFSVYLDIFAGFSSMYGSFTTIVLIMLWLYFCMYITLLGGEINEIMEERRVDRRWNQLRKDINGSTTEEKGRRKK